MSRSRRAWAMVIAAGATCAVLALASCEAFLVDPAPSETLALGLGFSLASSAAGDAKAFDRADAGRIQLRRRRDGHVVFDGSVPLTAAGTQREAAVRLDGVEEAETLDLDATLLSGGQALFRGTTSISVRKGQTASAEVPLQPIITQVQVSPTSVTLVTIGQTVTLQAAALFATGDTASSVAVEWQSQNASIASASQDGRITARGEGQTQVVARAGTASALVQVRVQAAVASVTVTPSSLNLIVGDERTLTAVARDANGNTLARTPQWSSSNALVATIDPNGRVRAAGGGQATISAAVEGRTGTASVSVTVPPPPSVRILSILQAGTSIPAPLTNVSGAIDIVTEVSFPSGTGMSWRVMIGTAQACSQSFTGGTGTQQLTCTVNTTAYPNGATTIAAGVTDAYGSASSGPVSIIINN